MLPRCEVKGVSEPAHRLWEVVISILIEPLCGEGVAGMP